MLTHISRPGGCPAGQAIGRALLAGDARDGALIRIGYTDSELTVTYEHPV
jgi:hypothetical protein